MIQNYSYRARSLDNKVLVGIVQAGSMEEAKKILEKNQLSPIGITVPKGIAEFVPMFNKVSIKEKAFFARQLAITLEAGLTLAQAMRLMIRQAKKGKFRQVLEEILTDVMDGFSFSSALMKHMDVFDNIFINVVKSGEATGKLELVLAQMATTMEKDVKLKGKLKGAMFYPAFIMIAMVGVAIVMLTQVIPQLQDVFNQAGQNLPASTRFLISLSIFIRGYWYVLLFGFLAFIIGFRIFARSDSGRKILGQLSLKIPLFGPINIESVMARFGRLMGVLLSSGVPLLDALNLIRDAYTNVIYQAAMLNISSTIERGIPMSVPINENPDLFPAMVAQMVAIGEQTGKMDEVMIRMAEYYEAEVDTKMGGISTLIEPIVILVLGVGVAWLVIAILMPVYQISSSVS